MTGTSGSLTALSPNSVAGQLTANQLTVGQETFSRELVGSTQVATTSQILRLSYFTARKSETSTQARVSSGSTAAGATPTLVRWGLYSIAANGDGTLVASIPNDTALFASLTTAHTRSWSAPVAVVAGQRYAFGILVVTAATAPFLMGGFVADPAENLIAPRINGLINGQSDLPASFLAGAVSTAGTRLYAAILP